MADNASVGTISVPRVAEADVASPIYSDSSHNLSRFSRPGEWYGKILMRRWGPNAAGGAMPAAAAEKNDAAELRDATHVVWPPVNLLGRLVEA